MSDGPFCSLASRYFEGTRLEESDTAAMILLQIPTQTLSRLLPLKEESGLDMSCAAWYSSIGVPEYIQWPSNTQRIVRPLARAACSKGGNSFF